jgi:hypothetical protein
MPVSIILVHESPDVLWRSTIATPDRFLIDVAVIKNMIIRYQKDIITEH